ncbi:uncharacterized protein MEPE_05243 [Melanopsichium pennsylvanicum]|uniref:Uncharacterized protein n=2 Tax=Melanopsichium pennsylvanicum TaxID=63383 RepID=A0AAJ5C7H2_9BASI|nr:putative protein [Melanopsichium pennsylvanicum 4]SNX86534.1 uncharacterized protein MEPE_05243 [Melanopsichium pennsylvanicum]
MPNSTITATATVSLFAPGVDQMIKAIESQMSKVNGEVDIKFSATSLATTTAPDGARATVWNVRAHEWASINGHTTKVVEDQKFVESHNYFSAIDASGAHIECHFDHINAPATCVNKQPQHHHTFTSTFKHARPFATAYHRHVQIKSHKATSSSVQASSSQITPTAAAAAVVQTTASVAQSDDGTASQSTDSSGSSAGSNTRMNSTSGAAKKAKSLPVLLVTASVLFTAVLAFQP